MIRAARAADAAAVCAIWNPIIRETAVTFTTDAKTVAAVVPVLEGGALVAEGPGGVLGFAFYGPFRAGPGYRFTVEHTVHLAPEARGRGLGRALLEGVLAEAAAAGARQSVGAVSGENPAGLAFHRALGFSEAAVLPGVGWKFGRPLDLHLMLRSCAF